MIALDTRRGAWARQPVPSGEPGTPGMPILCSLRLGLFQATRHNNVQVSSCVQCLDVVSSSSAMMLSLPCGGIMACCLTVHSHPVHSVRFVSSKMITVVHLDTDCTDHPASGYHNAWDNTGSQRVHCLMLSDVTMVLSK